MTIKPIEVPDWIRSVLVLDPTDIWGNVVGMGLAELSAVLSAVKRFDRRGQLVWYTDFEEGLQGTTPGSDHADSVGELSSSRAFFGAFSLKLDPRAAANSYVDWGRVIANRNPSRMGFEASVSLDADPSSFRFTEWYYDGTNAHRARCAYYPDTGNWTIWDGSNNSQAVISGKKLQTGANAWHQIKLVTDFENDKYVRLLVGENEVDLSAYGLYLYASANLGQIELRFTNYGAVATHAPCYLDSVVITQEEPT